MSMHCSEPESLFDHSTVLKGLHSRLYKPNNDTITRQGVEITEEDATSGNILGGVPLKDTGSAICRDPG